MWTWLRPSEKNLRAWQLGLLLLLLGLWHLASRDAQLAFFLGEPLQVAGRVWSWFMPMAVPPNGLFEEGLPGNADIYRHLGTTLLETVLARDQAFDGYRIEHDFPRIGRRSLILNARRVPGKDGKTRMVLLAMEEERAS